MSSSSAPGRSDGRTPEGAPSSHTASSPPTRTTSAPTRPCTTRAAWAAPSAPASTTARRSATAGATGPSSARPRTPAGRSCTSHSPRSAPAATSSAGARPGCDAAARRRMSRATRVRASGAGGVASSTVRRERHRHHVAVAPLVTGRPDRRPTRSVARQRRPEPVVPTRERLAVGHSSVQSSPIQFVAGPVVSGGRQPPKVDLARKRSAWNTWLDCSRLLVRISQL